MTVMSHIYPSVVDKHRFI